MEFLKKHYEKILLSVVLLGLAAAAAWLPAAIREAQSELEVADPGGQASTKPMAAIDLAAAKAAMERVKNPTVVVLSGEHNLFNPVTWKRTATNEYKVLKEGPAALNVKSIRPLYTVIAYDKVAGAGYYLNIQQQSKKRPSVYTKTNEVTKSGLFILRAVKGAPEDPSELILEIPDLDQPVSISKNKPFQRIDGYAADLRYDPDKKNFDDVRANQTISFGGESYKIIAITNNAVTVSANSTTKKTTIYWNGTP